MTRPRKVTSGAFSIFGLRDDIRRRYAPPMHFLLRLVVAATCLIWSAGAAMATPLILVSIDGLRSDDLDRGITPNLSALAAQGVRAPMHPSFPAKTYPNHYAMVTGLRPDRSGMVDNAIQDPAIPGVTFKTADRSTVRDRRWWDQAEPTWVTAERAGIVTASMFWPGAEAAIQGVRPRYSPAFRMEMPAAARVDQVLAWLDLPKARRPAFITLYLDTVDTAGHRHGPGSPQSMAAIRGVDAAVGRLRTGLRRRGIEPNLIVVSDHGMAATPPGQHISMDAILPPTTYRALTMGAFVTLYPVRGKEARVAKALTPRPHPRLQCWPKAKIPAYLKYGRNPRVAPYVCLADVGWEVVSKAKPRTDLGDHGFDPYAPDMTALFVANGPGFRKAARLHAFDNVHLYPLLARLLGVKARPGDGNIAAFNLIR